MYDFYRINYPDKYISYNCSILRIIECEVIYDGKS